MPDKVLRTGEADSHPQTLQSLAAAAIAGDRTMLGSGRRMSAQKWLMKDRNHDP
jgi:hypothetical protein